MCAGRAGASGAKSMAAAMFDAVSEFAASSPQNLRQICVVVQQRGMVDEFVSVIDSAETTGADHPSKSVWTRLKGSLREFPFTHSATDDRLVSYRHRPSF